MQTAPVITPLWFDALMNDQSPRIFAAMSRGTDQAIIAANRATKATGNVLIVVPGAEDVGRVHDLLAPMSSIRVTRSRADLFTCQLDRRHVIVLTYEALEHDERNTYALRGKRYSDVIGIGVWATTEKQLARLLVESDRDHTARLLLIGTPPGPPGQAKIHPATALYWSDGMQKHTVRSVDWPSFDHKVAVKLIEELGPEGALVELMATVPPLRTDNDK